MKRDSGHPEDFSPYLDREVSDPRFQEILAHLESCGGCREEVGKWKTFDSRFRSPEAEIEVPPFQWQRIEARLQEAKPQPRIAWLPYSWRPIWNVALASGVLVVALFAGLEVNRHIQETQILSAVSRYAQEEGRRIETGGNPFRVAASADNNPFFDSRAGSSNLHPAERR